MEQSPSPDPPLPTDDDEDDVAPPVPPDGGWGWVVVGASLFCNIIVDGVCFSFGIFYPEFLSYFQESRGKTAIVGSLIPGMYLGMGPVVSALANKYGCRTVTIVGALMAGASFFISTFSPNVDVLILTYGIMGGIGFGLMYLPAIVIVGFYFDKRRAFATGLAVCGSGIGTFLFAPFGRFLLDRYGWQGAYWIISGIILNGCICGALFRPLKAVSLRKLRPRQLRELQETPRGLIIQKIIEEKKRNRTISTGSLDGCIITRDNTLIKDPEKIKKINQSPSRLEAVQEEDELQHALPNRTVALLREENRAFRPPAPLPKEQGLGERQGQGLGQGQEKGQGKEQGLTEETPHVLDSQPSTPLVVEDSSDQNVASSTKSLSNLTTQDLPPMRGRAFTDVSRADYRISRRGEKVAVSTGSKGSKLNLSSLDIRTKEIARPLNRKDIFYTGSVKSLREYQTNPDMASYITSQTSLPADPESSGDCSPLSGVLKTMLDFSLLRSPTFMLLCTTSILAMTGFFTPFVYMTDNAIKLGIPRMQATLLLSVLGGANTLGRVFCGFISDQSWADCLLIHNVALVVAGSATCLVPLLHSFPLLVLYCIVFGLCIAAFITLRSIVLVELLGLEKLTSSFGLLLLFQGIASLIGSPIAGAIFDRTQSYTLSFIVSGALIAIAGVIALPVRRVAAWEARRWGPLGGQRNYTQIATEEEDTNL